jgi:hypothetical protein
MAQVKMFSLGGLGAPCCCTKGGMYKCGVGVGACEIPTSNLMLTWAGSPGGMATLVYNGFGTWISACIAVGAGFYLTFQVACTGGVPQFAYSWYLGLTNCNILNAFGSCTSVTPPCSGNTVNLISLVCGSGFTMVLANGCCTGEGAIFTSGTVTA